jgi:hypothetical protein
MMNTKTKMIAVAAAIGVGIAQAQEFGEAPAAERQEPVQMQETAEAAFVQQPGGAIAQDQMQAEKDMPQTATSELKPEEELAKYVREEKIPSYDPDTGRIVVQASVTFDVRNPKVSDSFIEERVSRMTELLLNAKAEVVKSICSEMSAERLLELPANPIRKQLDKEEKEIRKHIDEVKGLLDEAGIALDEAKRDTKELNAPELMAAVAEVCRPDSKYAAGLDAEKKSKFEAALNDYKTLKAEYDALVKKVEQVQEQFKDSLSKKSRASISLSAEMQIHGCTILEQCEGGFIQDGKWKYQIAALFSWSEESQKAAEAILDARSVKFAPGGHTVEEWLDHNAQVGALADWLGPRTYIDRNGDMWYLGIYATPVCDDAIDDEKAVKAAALLARAEVGYALYAQLFTTNALDELHLDFKVDGEAVSRKLRDYSEKTMESFAGLRLFGLSKIGPTYNLKHDTGHDIHVVVYGVNASNAETMKSIQSSAHKLGIAINTKQEVERGRQAQMKKLTEMSRDNAAARNIGERQAIGETAAAFAPEAAPAAPAAAQPRPAPAAPVAAPEQKGLRKGTRFIRRTDDF